MWSYFSAETFNNHKRIMRPLNLIDLIDFNAAQPTMHMPQRSLRRYSSSVINSSVDITLLLLLRPEDFIFD